ncbi:Outer membrane protein OprM [Pseudomonas fluorescens]|jgi:multidrug efflux system outer membrane protein|uniref:Outer membrane protein OprM n=1 Tax=Pseudomonas fluorescens TaxID=294 RepID=A0A5E7AE63_PSEFL|nr:efflux transporter outer membrane subunit [Pseudomonas fluorescens]VVM36131.1 Outer membrane protein OprM [Pseudomonas fluorescens]VVN77682.1 Outer membrane protein OprM [Pseudomonas fluorescens]VVO68285.1 Outer membrane protein OprM [Pseudomonas fluorescens]
MRTLHLPLLICLSLTGCMLGPDYQRPATDAPDAYRYADQEANNLSNTLWWEQFKDPVLNDLIRSALAENKDIKIAAARVEEFQGRYGVVRSQMFPQIGAGAQGSRSRAPRDNGPVPLDSSVDPIYKNYQATLNVSWELDVWGRLRRLNESARADLLSSEEGRRTVILSLVSSVASSYIALRNLDRQLEIARTTAKARGDSYDIFKLRFGAGTISEMELAQNLSEFQRTQASVAQFESQVAQQENNLAVLLGRNPGPIIRGRDLTQLTLPSVPAGLPSDLLERRPDLRQAELNLISANAQIGAAKALYFPTISLTGLLGSVSNQLSNLFTGPSATWSYGLAASMPIFTAGGIAGQVQQAEAFQQQTLLVYQQSIQSAFRDVENALVAASKSREQLASQASQVEALRTYTRFARLRYDNGYTSYIEVLDAERSLFDAELNYTQTRGSVFTAMIDVYKATGGGWVTEADKLTATVSEKKP